MKPEYFLIAAVVLIAIIAIASSKKDKKALSIATLLPDLSQPLTGTDVARALFPAHGTVTATGCSVAWSDTELAPMVPMAITGGAA